MSSEISEAHHFRPLIMKNYNKHNEMKHDKTTNIRDVYNQYISETYVLNHFESIPRV